MSKIEDHKLFKAMEYAAEHTFFTEAELTEAADFAYYDWHNLGVSMFVQSGASDGKYQFRFETFMSYLEYIELQDARKSSKRAMQIAIGAICISILLAILSILVPLVPLLNPWWWVWR